VGLFANGTPTAKFNAIGDACIGRIVDIAQTQRTEYLRDGGVGDLMFWSAGRPVAGAATDPRTGQANQPVLDHVITVDTGKPDANGETEMRIFVKGKAELAAVKQACREAGARDVEIGGLIKKIWVSGAGGVADPRVYEFKYKAPETNNPVREVLDKMNRAHQTSPVTAVREAALAQAAAQPGLEGNPPF
jgi:hypothetical protein